VRVAETELQQESCSVFLDILQQGLVPVQNYTQTFLQTILSCVDNKDPGRPTLMSMPVARFYQSECLGCFVVVINPVVGSE